MTGRHRTHRRVPPLGGVLIGLAIAVPFWLLLAWVVL